MHCPENIFNSIGLMSRVLIEGCEYEVELDIVRLERKAKSGVTLSLEELANLTDEIDNLKEINEGIEPGKKWDFRTC